MPNIGLRRLEYVGVFRRRIKVREKPVRHEIERAPRLVGSSELAKVGTDDSSRRIVALEHSSIVESPPPRRQETKLVIVGRRDEPIARVERRSAFGAQNAV